MNLKVEEVGSVNLEPDPYSIANLVDSSKCSIHYSCAKVVSKIESTI